MDLSRKAVFSVLQTPPGCENGPVPYLANCCGPIGAIQVDWDYKLSDFCLIHQIVYKEIYRREAALDAAGFNDIKLGPDLNSWGEVQKANALSFAMAKEDEHGRALSFVDQIVVVGLWSLCEQYLGRVFRFSKAGLEGIDPWGIDFPFRWGEIQQIFLSLGVNLESCSGYRDADECRAVNNAIKHSGKVDARLVRYGAFSGLEGASLEGASLEMQRYLNGVSDLIGSVIERCNSILEVAGVNRIRYPC